LAQDQWGAYSHSPWISTWNWKNGLKASSIDFSLVSHFLRNQILKTSWRGVIENWIFAEIFKIHKKWHLKLEKWLKYSSKALRDLPWSAEPFWKLKNKREAKFWVSWPWKYLKIIEKEWQEWNRNWKYGRLFLLDY